MQPHLHMPGPNFVGEVAAQMQAQEIILGLIVAAFAVLIFYTFGF